MPYNCIVYNMQLSAQLTTRQRAVLEFIKKHVADMSFPPTVREIAGHFGFSSPLSAHQHIKALEKKGFIKKTGSKQRSIEVLGFRHAGGIRIPLVKQINISLPFHVFAAEDIEGYINVDRSLFNAEKGFAMKITSDSMIDAGILIDDIALVNPDTTAQNNDIVIVQIGEEAIIRQFIKRNNRVTLIPMNKQTKSITLHAEYVKVIGKVIGIMRNIQSLPLD